MSTGLINRRDLIAASITPFAAVTGLALSHAAFGVSAPNLHHLWAAVGAGCGLAFIVRDWRVKSLVAAMLYGIVAFPVAAGYSLLLLGLLGTGWAPPR